MRLEVKNIHVAYQGDLFILQGMSLEAPSGMLSIVIGANGTGKSTLLKTIVGLLTPKKGSVLLEGRDITGAPTREIISLGVGFMPQAHTSFQHMTVTENLQMACWCFRKDKGRVRRRIAWAMERFPVLGEKRTFKAGDLSGGQQRTLDMAKALLPDPGLLIVDEPSVGLSPVLAQDIYRELKAVRDEGKTILLVDQEIRSAMAVADMVNVVELGRVKASGPRSEFEGQLGEMVKSWLV